MVDGLFVQYVRSSFEHLAKVYSNAKGWSARKDDGGTLEI